MAETKTTILSLCFAKETFLLPSSSSVSHQLIETNLRAFYRLSFKNIHQLCFRNIVVELTKILFPSRKVYARTSFFYLDWGQVLLATIFKFR